MSDKATFGYLLEDEDITRIATAVTEQFMQCPPRLDEVLADTRRYSFDMGWALDYMKETPAGNYRLDMDITPNVVMLRFWRYGGDTLGTFVFKRKAVE